MKLPSLNKVTTAVSEPFTKPRPQTATVQSQLTCCYWADLPSFGFLSVIKPDLSQGAFDKNMWFQQVSVALLFLLITLSLLIASCDWEAILKSRRPGYQNSLQASENTKSASPCSCYCICLNQEWKKNSTLFPLVVWTCRPLPFSVLFTGSRFQISWFTGLMKS